MGLLLLLTYTLLSSWRMVDAQRSFTIRNITLTIEPSTDVTRDTNVTLRCKAIISSSGPEALSRKYAIYKDSYLIYNKTSNTSQDLLYPLPEVRVSNIGEYKCKITIKDKEMTSEAEKLTVKGLSKPLLTFNKTVVSEQEVVTATCTAPGETGHLYFFFYKDSKEIQNYQVNSNQSEATFLFSSVGMHKIHCTYAVLVKTESFKSGESNSVSVSVKELSIKPVLEIYPQSKIYEGEKLNILCIIRELQPSSESIHLYLSQGTHLLSTGSIKVNHSMVALAKDPGDFECSLEIGNVIKVVTEKVSVTELFSAPTLTMSPAEVFQKEYMTLTCKSERFATERLNKEELTYTLEQATTSMTSSNTGVFPIKALQYDFNYTCVARAKGIMKRSETLTVRPKVSVSTPKMSVVGRAVLGQPFRIICQSDTGSLPINYTLLRDYSPLSTTSVKQPNQQAIFTVTINKPDEISRYMCEAKNSNKEGSLSKRLNAAVIVPLSHPTLTVIPKLSEISEGDDLYLICGINGTPPVTFKWYRVGNEQPLLTNTTNTNSTYYQIHKLSKEHSGIYYCEAVNHANNLVRSEKVTIDVQLALWKKALIAGFCLLLVLVLVVVCVLYFRSKRVRVPRAAVSVWSERPPEAVHDELSSVVSSEPDVEYTEVVHPQPVDPAKGAADPHDYQGSVEYTALNGEQPEINHYHPNINSYQDLPVPVD
ncbi:platelet endothelial cell adhesion molecule isoform X3 [Mastacembelus armatus]|uniref:platelet endothelial cell adhesion molecule isoform X3 n=1 Tax=Mastacembelus armatus TaxID=205130 RepID=UPI000E456989|nr:platelet endothelial cell adhesion molecule-like isoform X3 [Mastacembelus armatus]